MRKTKIICTMGPATDSDEVLEKLMRGGMNVARFNFSHGSHEEQKERMDRIKAMREKCGKPVAMLLDTKGPEIRTGIFEEGKVTLEPGQQFVLTGREIRGNASMASITYPQLYQDEKPGNRILIDDGLIELIVKEIRGEDIICTVVNGGVISNHKGVNVPGVHIHLPYMSEKDKEDILGQFLLGEPLRMSCRSVNFWTKMGEKISISSQRLKMRKVWIRSMRSSAYRMEL